MPRAFPRSATRLALILPMALIMQGCLAKTALDVVTLPVKAAGKAVDLATTSQSEADEKRGREIRRREEKMAKLERQYEEDRADCERGKARACDDARETYAEIQALLPSLPLEPRR